MKVNSPIHLVEPKKYDSFDEVCAVFDSKEKAAKFVEKFKSRPDLEIIDGVLNPDFNQEQKAKPYYISLARTGSMPKDIFMCDYNRNLEARQEEYNICFYGGTEIHQGLFITKIYALSEKDALRKALLIRNSAIKSGEWDLAWERHKIQQTRLNLRGR